MLLFLHYLIPNISYRWLTQPRHPQTRMLVLEGWLTNGCTCRNTINTRLRHECFDPRRLPLRLYSSIRRQRQSMFGCYEMQL